MEQLLTPKKDIKGWGVDADFANRPAVPYWKKPEGGTGAHWTAPEQQPNFSDFQSIERKQPSHVFGNAPGPRGISGMIRGFAYQYSESSWGRWLPLMLADRIDVFEGIVEDIFRGRIPNPFAEMGLKSEFKYNRKSAVKKSLLFSFLFLIPLAIFMTAKKTPQAK